VLVEASGELVTNDGERGEGPLGMLRGAAVAIEDDRGVSGPATRCRRV
jgi:hypothetical protein